MCALSFWHVGTKDVLHVLFQTNLKPNDSDVEHSSLVKHRFFCEALAYAKHRVFFDVKHCIDVGTQLFSVCMFSHVCMFSCFCIGLMWTGLD